MTTAGVFDSRDNDDVPTPRADLTDRTRTAGLTARGDRVRRPLAAGACQLQRPMQVELQEFIDDARPRITNL